MPGPLSELSCLRAARTRRISSYDRTGGNADCITIAAGETVTIAEIDGTGVIRHIWCTVAHDDPLHRRHLILRMYWDGAKEPSVESPIGDFFGQGWGEEYNYAALPLCAAPSRGKALNCYFPMPFAAGARIEVWNDSDKACKAFYYYVDYEECANVDEHARFHACWRRTLHWPAASVENEWNALFADSARNLSDRWNHLIIDTRGRGHYVGINYYVDCPTPMWYGEGDDMWFVDGEKWPPSLHGTGTEDYFNSAWCPKEIYVHPYFGYARINEGQTGWLGRTHCYRFHIEDPICFERSLRGSIEVGHANCLTADIITVAYWYQLPCVSVPRVPDRRGRENMPTLSAVELHAWREAFRQLHGGKKVWGHEKLPSSVQRKLKARAQRKTRLATRAQRAATAARLAQEQMLRGQK
ncbi:MAG: DUF2961 domain-containing protein [bacterium]|nr:DUF2961 domain-containing protein [bacterium]